MKRRPGRAQRRRQDRDARKPAHRKNIPGLRWPGSLPRIPLPVAMFLVLVALMVPLYPWLVGASWFDSVLSLHASLFGSVFRLLGEEVSVNNDTITSASYSFQIVADCTPLAPSLIYIAALAVFPAPWRHRMVGILLGIFALAAVNIVRIVSLMYIAKVNPAVLESIHLIVWQGLMILFAVGLWMVWARRIRSRRYA